MGSYFAVLQNEQGRNPVASSLYGICKTDSGIAAKTVVLPEFSTLMLGVTAHIKFEKGNSASSPTLNINSSGELPLLARDGTYISHLESGIVLSLTYDGSSWIANGVSSGDQNRKSTRKNWITAAHRGYVEPGMHENTLAAFYNAYLMGADMIECDARRTSDNIFCSHHDATINIGGLSGPISSCTMSELSQVELSNDDKWGFQGVPTLKSILHLAYNTGMMMNIDMKTAAEDQHVGRDIAKLVVKTGMRGRVAYATNQSQYLTTLFDDILSIDPDAMFIDTCRTYLEQHGDIWQFKDIVKQHVPNYQAKCFCYTKSESDAQIIREAGAMLIFNEISEEDKIDYWAEHGYITSSFPVAMKYHPEMCEYHTGDGIVTNNFRKIEDDYFNELKLY